MINELANNDHIVMTRFTVTDDTGMIIGASGKGARGVTNTTILGRRHVIARFTARRNTVTGCAIVHDVGMIDECTSETIGVMAHATIGGGDRVGGHRGRLGGRINTIVIVVT